jgi:hypothetical protein
MREVIVQQKSTLLEHLDKILEFSGERGLDETFFEKAKQHIDAAAEELKISPIQAVLFALIFDLSVLGTTFSSKGDELFNLLKCSKAKYLEYLNEVDELVRKNYIQQAIYSPSPIYRIRRDYILALQKGKPICPESYGNLSIGKFFRVLSGFFNRRYSDLLILSDLMAILDTLVNENTHLGFIKKIVSHDLNTFDRALLLYFCSQSVMEGGETDADFIKKQFTDENKCFDVEQEFLRPLRMGWHVLQNMELVEYVNAGGFALMEKYQLTKKAKEELLVELEKKSPLNKSGFIMVEDIAAKSLFFNAEEEKKITRLEELLRPDNFKTVTERLGDNGLRKGFACLFSGNPGTGKTETVYQIARRTGRDIMPVEVSEIQSCWVGRSEENIRARFDCYRRFVKDTEIEPILFFNEADAIMSQRREFNGNSNAVDQMENSIQNIILEELENLDGILIATTNMAGNFDKAFERRFIYKIEFQKPSLEVRKSIWKSLIPELRDFEAATLAGRFIFSGGQIENIARKRTVETVLAGSAPSLETLISYCQDETMERESVKIGFAVP